MVGNIRSSRLHCNGKCSSGYKGRAKGTPVRINYTQIQQYGYEKYKNFSFDLLDFIKQLNGGTIPATVENSLSQAVVAKNCLNGEEYPFVTLKIDATRYCGMGMYFPGRQIKSSWDKYCQSSVACTMLPGGMKYSHNTISRPSSVQALMMEVYVHFVQ